MSRIPQHSTPSRTTPSRASGRTPSRMTSSQSLRAGTSTPLVRKASPVPPPGGSQTTLRTQPSVKSLRTRTTSTTSTSSVRSPTKRRVKTPDDIPPVPPKAPALSIREQIALKRAEAKKSARNSPDHDALPGLGGLEDAAPPSKDDENIIDLGRWSVKETIERARSSGAINLANRALPCLPSALFEIHLGITPEPLKLVPVEPPITTATSDDISASRTRNGSENGPSWYEAQDLEILKAWSNEILEIQPEIFMFGSLKSVDLHNNKLSGLPDTFADLTALTSLDLSHNNLTVLPSNLYALPNLTTLNISHNAFAALPFNEPFAAPNSNPLSRTSDPRGDWFSKSITRATVPLPKLVTLDVSNNNLTAASIDYESNHLPQALTKLDLSGNPLGKSTSLLRALSCLHGLAEFRCEKADISDDSFPVNLLQGSTADGTAFVALTLLDLGETAVTRPVVEAALLPNVIKQQLDFDVTNEAPKQGTLRVILGKKIVKEAWEIEAERRGAKGRARPAPPSNLDDIFGSTTIKESWESEVDQALLTEGARRRARAAAAAAAVAKAPSPPPIAPLQTPTFPKRDDVPAKSARSTPQVKVVQKEAWEIEAEQGLLTAGGRRRARAAAAAAALSVSTSLAPEPGPISATSTKSASPTPASCVLSQPQYYSSNTHTLTLPPSLQPTKALHNRSFSMAPSFISPTVRDKSDPGLAVPTPTLPLTAIISQPFSHNLKVLILANRRMDTSFTLPSLDDQTGPYLPFLEELSLEGCNLGNSVPVSRSPEGSTADISAVKKNEPLLPLLTKLFPSLQSLDLSYNALKSDALDKDTLAELILASEPDILGQTRKGLRHLRLRGNRITELDGFQAFAELFKGNRDVPTWKLEELDLRDNEIGKLPAELGLLPLDVFLVDGNVFRIPHRRVWEREGTKGLLSWLRGRIE